MKYNFLANPLVKRITGMKNANFHILLLNILLLFSRKKMRPTPESCLIGVIFLITLFVNSQSRVMLDRFWVDAGEPNVITKPLLIKDAIEAKKASIQPPQNHLLNPKKISAFEPYPK